MSERRQEEEGKQRKRNLKMLDKKTQKKMETISERGSLLEEK